MFRDWKRCWLMNNSKISSVQITVDMDDKLQASQRSFFPPFFLSFLARPSLPFFSLKILLFLLFYFFHGVGVAAVKKYSSESQKKFLGIGVVKNFSRCRSRSWSREKKFLGIGIGKKFSRYGTRSWGREKNFLGIGVGVVEKTLVGVGIGVGIEKKKNFRVQYRSCISKIIKYFYSSYVK